MIRIKIPNLKTNYGLLVTDSDATLVSWRRGAFERLASFSNDDEGVQQFSVFLQKDISKYRGAGFHILTNVIGEDYRVEQVAHLIGKYRSDFHKRRISQLFRGATLSLSEVQGREERGRRDDIVLFYGLLAENKVIPWMNAILRVSDVYLAGVHAAAFVSTPVLQAVEKNWRQGNQLLMTLHENGLLRQTQYSRGRIRFSRVSKINDENVDEFAASIKKELDRTMQYLHSLKISVASGLSVQFICPGAMVGQLREKISSTDKISFNFHDAAAVSQKVGLSAPMGEYGRDSSLSLHSMFSHLWLTQLAPFRNIRFYWMRAISQVAATVLAIYAVFGVAGPIGEFYEGYQLDLRAQSLTEERAQKQSQYQSELQLSDTPPSDPENISAVSKVFRVLEKIDISPSQLMYYVSQALEKNRRVEISSMRWYVVNDINASEGKPEALVSGEDIYQVMEIDGFLSPILNENYLDVANRAQVLVDSFEKRGDISIVPVVLPSQDLDQSALSGQFTEGYNVEEAKSRDFKLRILWKAYSKESLDTIVNEV